MKLRVLLPASSESGKKPLSSKWNRTMKCKQNEIHPSRTNTFSSWKKAFLAMSSEVSYIWERREAWSGSDRDFNTI